ALKSLSDMLKGKQGRFRQNLLGKRVDYSGRSVIVVGPKLELHECGLPKNMAAELFKPFIIRKLLERGIVKTVKSAKKIVDRKSPVVWEILENVMKGHPVLLNRAPTLHRLGIQAFQPKLIEGKAIQLHPLVCSGFNADFDGDQMAVHVPLSYEACLEAMLLMLASHNILHPASGSPIAVPSQDMVLGIYYMTKARSGLRGEGMTFSSPKEVRIAYNEDRVDLHAIIKVRIKDYDRAKGEYVMNAETGKIATKIIDTTVGRVLFNEIVPEEVGYQNDLMTKRSMRKFITDVVRYTSIAEGARFLDRLKNLGFSMAFKGGLSFSLDNVIIPTEKQKFVDEAYERIEEVNMNYSMGVITENERYNQVIDIWTFTTTKLAEALLDKLSSDDDGFNPIYMMLDSGARGSKEQVKQLGGMRGLMAKPQKTLKGSAGEIIENPILSNFKEGLSVLEYFISTHGARKGLADTALKTADAGYLTRRLVDVSQDVIVTEDDCGTLRGLTMTALIENDDEIESLYDRIMGRVVLTDVLHPETDEVVVPANTLLDENLAQEIVDAGVEEVDVRSPLTCDSKRGVCAMCYGRHMATNNKVDIGESVGVIAAQSIGEPGTQLTLRTFHVGGTAQRLAAESQILTKKAGKLAFDNIEAVERKTDTGKKEMVIIGRSGEIRVVDEETNKTLGQHNIPYGSRLYVKDKQKVEKGEKLVDWDPYNAVILANVDGTVKYEDVIENVTYNVEIDEQTGSSQKIVIENRDKSVNPAITILDKSGDEVRSYNIPVGANIVIDDNDSVKAGQILVKIPRVMSKTADITGGLPRVTELFEARNPSNPAVVSEIDGTVQLGTVKRGNREIFVTSRDGSEERKYMVPLSKHILVQDNDLVYGGSPLSDGAITPLDILRIKGMAAVQEYIVNEIQAVYRLQGVGINNKHIEVIVRQMMQKVYIVDPGDTLFLEKEVVDRREFTEENDWIFDKKVVLDPGGSSNYQANDIISLHKLRDENQILKRKEQPLIQVRDAKPAVARPTLQGITRASLGTKSFMSAASFQETTKVLSEAAIAAKTDDLLGLKENVIVGHLIPAGTGMRQLEQVYVASKEEWEKLQSRQSKQEEGDAVKELVQ
ncbi:MAG: DNA-directed RNA polymerase subunit beta', partial [Bacteroidota bacterium]